MEKEVAKVRIQVWFRIVIKVSKEVAIDFLKNDLTFFEIGQVQDWSEWSGWSECSTTCGSGIQLRTRTCPGPNECTGSNMETKQCLDNPKCFSKSKQNNKNYFFNIWITGDFGEWSEWSECGKGIRTRSRTCPGPNECDGLDTETESCEDNHSTGTTYDYIPHFETITFLNTFSWIWRLVQRLRWLFHGFDRNVLGHSRKLDGFDHKSTDLRHWGSAPTAPPGANAPFDIWVPHGTAEKIKWVWELTNG